MGRIRMRGRAKGFDRAKRKVGAASASQLADKLDTEMHVQMQKIATDAYGRAPVEAGALRTSLLRSVTKEAAMDYIFGSYMPYAQRQEYEHKTKGFYMHDAMFAGKIPTRRALTRAITSHFASR